MAINARTWALARGVTIIGATAALVTGVTFAALQSNTVTLAGNQLSVTNDVLRIFNNSTGWDVTAPGFTFYLVPGTESAKQPFYLQNNSGATLGLTVQLVGSPDYHSSVGDSSKITVRFYDGNGNLKATTNMSALTSPVSLGANLAPNSSGDSSNASNPNNFQVSFKIDPNTVIGTSATVTGIDLGFTGTSQ